MRSAEIIGYKIVRNSRPFANPKYFLMPITAEPVAPAVEGKQDAPQTEKTTKRRRERLLRYVRSHERRSTIGNA